MWYKLWIWGNASTFFGRFFVVTKFILPTANDLKFAALNFDRDCKYLRDTGKNQTEDTKQHTSSLITYCRKIGTLCIFLKAVNKSFNKTPHHILKNEIDLILPQFPTRKEKERYFHIANYRLHRISLFEGISSFLHNRRHKAVKALETKTNIQWK